MTPPKHLELEPLLDGTPLSIERIKQAWSGLSIRDRASLLTILLDDPSKEHKALRWSHMRNSLIDLALMDDNAYIRYLAAKNVSAPWGGQETPIYLEEKARFEKVQSDPVLLVQYAEEEVSLKLGGFGLDNPELFWKRTQTERLALVNGVKEAGETIAELLSYATKTLLPNNAVSINEIFDVLVQYLSGPSIVERVAESVEHAHRSGDGYDEFSAGKSVEALWEVIPAIPKEIAYLLIDCLPDKAGFMTDIPHQVIDSLDEHQLEHLLWRNDITLKEVRRRLYNESTNDALRSSAVASQRFELLDSDISELVYSPKELEEDRKKKVKTLAILAENCQGATLVQMQAILYLLDLMTTQDFFSEEMEKRVNSCHQGMILQTKRARNLTPIALHREVLEMRLFELAKNLAPNDESATAGEFPEKLIPHKGLVVPLNPWQTYLNLRKVVRLDHWRQTIGYLPSVYIHDFDLPEGLADNSDDGTGDLDNQLLFDLLSYVQSQANEISVKDRAELDSLSNAFSMISKQIKKMETVFEKRAETLHSQIEKLASTIKILLWAIGVILGFLLFRSR